MEFLQKILELLSGAEAQAGVILIVVEFILRFVKSSKPLSILYVVADAIKLVGKILTKAGELSDKVLPQRVLEQPKQ